MDIDSRDRLIASHLNVDEIASVIGADSLGFLPEEDLAELVLGKPGEGYCSACFNGKYPTPVPSEKEKNRFEYKISEGKNYGKQEQPE